MKIFTKLLLVVFCVNVFNCLQGQTVSLINNPDAGYGAPLNYVDPIVLNGNLFMQYGNAAFKYQLAKYDGNTINLIPNPDNGTGFYNNYVWNMFLTYNNNIYFSYVNSSNKYQIAKYDGTSVSLIPNPDAGTGFRGNAIVANNILYFQYANASGINQLAKFDGTSITLIPNPDAGNGFTSQTQGNKGYMIEYFNGNIYSIYKNILNKYQLAKYDGSSTTLIPNPDAGDFNSNSTMTIFNNTLLCGYKNTSNASQLAKYDGTSVSLINNPDASTSGFYAYSPVVYNGELYYVYSSSITGKNELIKYNGTSNILINNTNGGTGITPGTLLLVNNNICFSYWPTTSTSVSRLAKFDGNNISLVGTQNYGSFNGMNSDGVTLYYGLQYTNTNYQLAKYDGTNLTIFTNPDAGVGFTGKPIFYTNKIYADYRIAASTCCYHKLATIDNVTPLTLLSFTALKLNNTIQLNWQTDNEINTSHFNIQRSKTGVEFTYVGKLNTTGNSQGNYKFDDVYNASVTTLYYRLQMMDKDGSFSYSKTVAIKLNAKDNITIYPNPVHSILYAQVTGTNSSKATLQITDIQGKVLQQQQVQLSVGSTSASFNTSTLAKGNYVLVVRSDDGTQHKTFIKQQ